MMTRGTRKPGQEGEPDEGAGALADQGATVGATPEGKLEELTDLVKSLLKSQAARDLKMEKELSRQEQRWKGMQHQFQQIQQHVSSLQKDRPGSSAVRTRRVTSDDGDEDEDDEDDEPDEKVSRVGRGFRPQNEPRLLPLTAEDDIEHFLTTFERMAQVCRWPRDEWAIRLIPLLTGKARMAYVLMDVADTEDYDKVKEAILAKYEITADTYRRRFRSLTIEQGETPRELYVRLKELFIKWIKPENLTVKDISEQIILEQFLRMVHPELEVWIREHDPKTAEEAARLAEVFTSARRGNKGTNFSRETHHAHPSKSIGGDEGSGQFQGRNFSRRCPPSRPSHNLKLPSKSSKQDVRCYHCNGFGHTQHFCPVLKSKPSLLCSVPRPNTVKTVEKGCTVPVLVNGQREEALLDSGCFQTLVNASLISGEKLSRGELECVHGDEHHYPMSDVYLTVGGVILKFAF